VKPDWNWCQSSVKLIRTFDEEKIVALNGQKQNENKISKILDVYKK
jgi:hypothetical protein